MSNEYETSAYASPDPRSEDRGHAAHNGQDPVQLALAQGGELSDADHAFFKDYLLAAPNSGLHQGMDFVDGVVNVGLSLFIILLMFFFAWLIYVVWSSL